ncbi:unnamed protein product [Symbiodinium sp. KB8]|nr:unnamed protein product [Symbiodinium sp. KB8]
MRAALDSQNPKSALTELILDVAKDASDALMEMSLPELKQHAQEMGITEAQLSSAEKSKNPKVALIMAIFGSNRDQEVQLAETAPGEVSFDVGTSMQSVEAFHELVSLVAAHALELRRKERQEDVLQSPASPEGAAKALPPVPSSQGRLPEVKFEDVASSPSQLLPWAALHAPLKPGHRTKLAAQAVLAQAGVQDEEPDAVEEVSLVQDATVPELPRSLLARPMLLLGNQGKVELDWALMLLALHMWRRASSTADRKEFLVDNELLQAPTSGLSYFFSKSLDDVDAGKTAMWGQVVVGKRHGEWVKVGHCCYLPTSLNGVQVLREDFDPSEVAGERARWRQHNRKEGGQLAVPRKYSIVLKMMMTDDDDDDDDDDEDGDIDRGYAETESEHLDEEAPKSGRNDIVDLTKDLKKENSGYLGKAQRELEQPEPSPASSPSKGPWAAEPPHIHTLFSLHACTGKAYAAGFQQRQAEQPPSAYTFAQPSAQGNLKLFCQRRPLRNGHCNRSGSRYQRRKSSTDACSQSDGEEAGLPSEAGRTLGKDATAYDRLDCGSMSGSKELKEVEFCPTPMNTVHVITPYSKVYGTHPKLFHYNRKGEQELNDAGVAAMMDAEAETEKLASGETPESVQLFQQQSRIEGRCRRVQALQRSVVQRRDLDASMNERAEDTQLELEAAAERAALEAGLLAGSAAAAAGNKGDVMQDLASATVARNAAEHRKRIGEMNRLKEELKAVEVSTLVASNTWYQMPAADVLDAAEQAPPELAQKAAELAARAAALKRSEQALDAKRAEAHLSDAFRVRAATEEANASGDQQQLCLSKVELSTL